jgi:hypothetical protein
VSPKLPGSVRSVLELVAEGLNEAVMGFLALVALGIALAPLALSLNPRVEAVLDSAEWLIIGALALESGNARRRGGQNHRCPASTLFTCRGAGGTMTGVKRASGAMVLRSWRASGVACYWPSASFPATAPLSYCGDGAPARWRSLC